jgi:hypothetical protein
LISNLAAKIKESAVSVVPVMGIVFLLHFTLAPLHDGLLSKFLFGGLLLIVGLGIFLMGADIGMVPFGQKVGSALTRRRSLILLLPASFAIGFAVTIAEPDVQVLAIQVSSIMSNFNRDLLLTMIAAGVGFFLLIATARVVFQAPLRALLIGFYTLVFIACAFVDPIFIGVAFDAGGATTGPITVPFIMALGVGVAASMKKKEGDDSSFGMVGLASIGPIAAVALMGFFSSPTGVNVVDRALAEREHVRPLVDHFLHILPDVTHEIFMALLPLVLIFLFFQFTLLRLPAQQVKRMLFGMFYAFVGLVLFMTGVSGGFSPAGHSLGLSLGQNCGPGAIIGIGLLLGAVVVCAEPAVWILTKQVEEVSGGHIRRPIMLAALSLSIALAVALGMIRVSTGMRIWWVLLPGYGLSLALTFACPRLFTAIAFDSGGVASGPMATTFLLSLTLGVSVAVGGNPTTDAFGMIAMIAMAPLFTIQLLGLAFKYMENKQKRQDAQKESRDG